MEFLRCASFLILVICCLTSVMSCTLIYANNQQYKQIRKKIELSFAKEEKEIAEKEAKGS